MFDDALGITGIALTKLDGTAKGGIVVSICRELSVPLQYIGVGEGVEDLQIFDPEKFVAALF
jgi:fused signal recognition particle receptor